MFLCPEHSEKKAVMTVVCFLFEELVAVGGSTHGSNVLLFFPRVLLEAGGRSHDSNVFCFTCYWRKGQST